MYINALQVIITLIIGALFVATLWWHSRRRNDTQASLTHGLTEDTRSDSVVTSQLEDEDVLALQRRNTPVVINVSDSSINNLIFLNPSDNPSPSDAEIELLAENAQDSLDWEEILDEMEDGGLSSDDLQAVVDQISGLSATEKKLVKDATNEVDRHMRLMTILRWRHDLRVDCFQRLEKRFYRDEDQAEREGFTNHRSSSIYNVPRLRLALQRIKSSELNRLPALSLAILHKSGCLSPSEYRRVTKKKTELSTVFLEKGESDLRVLRSLLLLQHRDIYIALLEQYFKTDVSTDTPFHHGLPRIPNPYVHRDEHETLINRWMESTSRTVGIQSMYLLICGMGSVGKTYLANFAGHRALSAGFHCVFWIRAKSKKLEKSQRKQLNEAKRRDDVILIIVDDAENNTIFDSLPERTAVIITSRLQAIEGIEVERCFIEGLTVCETDKLLTSIIGISPTESLQRCPNKWEIVMRLCKERFYMPLTVNIIASILHAEEKLWLNLDTSYFQRLEDDLIVAKKELEPKFPRTGTPDDYYKSVYAAIYASLKRLENTEKDNHECYLFLSLFDCQESILPTSVSKIWTKTMTETTAILSDFATRSILINLGDNLVMGQKEFKLHSLFYELLAIIITNEKRLSLQQQVIDAYFQSSESPSSGQFVSVDDADRFFYSKFVQFCVKTKRTDIGACCLCRLPYIMTRIRLDLSDDLLSDFTEIGSCCQNSDRLQSYKRLLETSLSTAIEYSDSHIILRASLARRHETEVYNEARQIVATHLYRDRKFFLIDSLWGYSLGRLLCLKLPRRVITENNEIGISTVISVDVLGEQYLLGIHLNINEEQYHRVVLFDNDSPVAIHTCTSPIIDVHLLSASDMCVIVTEINATIFKINDDSEFQKEVAVEWNTYLGRCVAVDVSAGYLWAIISPEVDAQTSDSTVICFSISTLQFILQKQFPCGPLPVRIVSRHCGRMAAISTVHETHVVSLDDPRLQEIPLTGNTVGFLCRGNWFVLYTDQPSLSIRIIDLSLELLEPQVIHFNFRLTDASIFTYMNNVVVVDRTSGICELYDFDTNSRRSARLSGWSNTPYVFIRADQLLSWKKYLNMYSLSKLENSPIFDSRMTGLVGKPQFVSWVPEKDDMVVVAIERASVPQLSVHALLQRTRLVSFPIGDLSPLQMTYIRGGTIGQVALSARSIAATDGRAVGQWNIVDGAQIQWVSEQNSAEVMGISLGGDENGQLYGVVKDSTKRQTIVFQHLLDNWANSLFSLNLSTPMQDWTLQGMWIISSSIVLWWTEETLGRPSIGRCYVCWEAEPDQLRFEADEIRGCRVSADGKWLLLWRWISPEESPVSPLPVEMEVSSYAISPQRRYSKESTGAGNRPVDPETSEFPSDWTLCVWDLTASIQVCGWRKEGVRSAIFSRHGTSVAFFTASGSLYVAREVDNVWMVNSGWLLRGPIEQELLSFDEDCLLIQIETGIIEVGLQTERRTLIWDWSWVADERTIANFATTNSCIANPTGSVVTFCQAAEEEADEEDDILVLKQAR